MVFFRYFNFYRIYFSYNLQTFLLDSESVAYYNVNVVFLKFYYIFYFIKKFQVYFLYLFSELVVPYVLIAAYKMIIGKRKLYEAGHEGVMVLFDALRTLEEHVYFEPYTLNSVFFDHFHNYYCSLFLNDKIVSNYNFFSKFLDYDNASKYLLMINPSSIFFYNVFCLVLVYYAEFNFIKHFSYLDSLSLFKIMDHFFKLSEQGLIRFISFLPKYYTLDDYFDMKLSLDKLLLDVFNYNVYNQD